MSTTLSLSPPVKKTSSCVRPGVREMRARLLRPVSALIRLDLPTLERPAKATSTPCIGGNEAGAPAAPTNRHSPAKRRRPASISARLNVVEVIGAGYLSAGIHALRHNNSKDVDARHKAGHDAGNRR